MYVLVKALILPVGIHVDGRVDERVIHSGIKILFGFLITLYHNFMQLLFPLLLAGGF